MAKIVIAAFGTRGDVAPLTGIGRRLAGAGHEVTMTAPAMFAGLVTGSGLRHLAHDPRLDGGAIPAALKFFSPAGMRATGEALLDVLREEPMDALLLSPFTELAGRPLAEARKIPSIGVRLQPLSATGDFPPSILGAWSAGPSINRAAGRLTRAAIDRMSARTVAGFRARLGLPVTRNRPAWPVLYGFSPSVVPRPQDWRPGLDVVGYWWPGRPADWQPPSDVVSFLESGAPPVFLGFGSLPMTKKHAARLSELIPLALRKAGVRGIVQAGWAGLHADADHVLTVGDLPHDWLFGNVAAVVHACGAGTTAAGLRAGLPAVAMPGPVGDQRFWAGRLRELGVSAATLSGRTLTADTLAAAITTARTDPAHRDNAQRLAANLANEDGAAAVLAAIERR